ncbi:MAG TPA: CHAP domain-containing protein [Microthrixaceae bacterium]|nr:CHAP domain-containing protein [Microthrixaceae bacterium]
MNTRLQHPPLWRVLRTALAVVVALAGLLPAALAVLAAVGVHVDEPLVVAIGAIAVLVATKLNAAIADAGNVPVWRTLGQVLAALAGVVAPAAAALATAGRHLDTAQITALLAAATMLVAGVQNLLEHRGVIPELGIPGEAQLLVRTDNAVRVADGPQPDGDQLVADLLGGELDMAEPDPPAPSGVRGLVGGVRRALSGGGSATRIRADVAKVLAVARAQAGISESPPYSNRTKFSEWYGLIGPWCAMYVSWVFDQAGYRLPPIRTAKGFAYCPDIVNWAKRNGLWHDATVRPKPGWIVLFDFPGDGVNRPSHVGIVEAVLPDGRISTWEGNTSSGGGRDGGSVVNHFRRVSVGIIGYVQVDDTRITEPPRAERWLPFHPGATDASIAARGGFRTEVTEVQMILKRLAGVWGAPDVDPGPVDGVYGPRSQAAVRAYKRRIRALQELTGQKLWPNTDENVGPVTVGSLRWWNQVSR